MLTVGSRLTGQAIDVDFLGQGVIKHEDYVIFVKAMLKDEVADIEITSLKKRFAEAKIIQLIKRSPTRKDVDMMFESCDLIHMDDLEQLIWQQKITQDTLKKIAKIDAHVDETLTDQRFTHYRNKSVFHPLDTPILNLGLYALNNERLIRTDSFILSDLLTNRILASINRAKINLNHHHLRHVVIRTNENNQALITLVSDQKTYPGLEKLLQVLKGIPEVIGVTGNIKHHERHILSHESYLLYGQATIDLKLGSWIYPVSDQSFFQVNIPVIKKAYDLIKNNIKKDAYVIDAYSGVGSIGYYIIDQVKHMTFIESNRDAILMTKMMKDKYQLDQVSIIEKKVDEALNEVSGDVLIIDPPRQGLTPGLLNTILTQSYNQIFYLSCDVKTLARDLAVLQEGYTITKIVPIRMFPQTTSIETFVMMHKKKRI